MLGKPSGQGSGVQCGKQKGKCTSASGSECHAEKYSMLKYRSRLFYFCMHLENQDEKQD